MKRIIISLRKSSGKPELFPGNLPSLKHLYLNIDASGKIQVGKSVNNFRRDIDDIQKAFVHPHLKLLAGIFMHEGGAIDSVLPNFRWQRHRTYHLGPVAERRVHNLLHRGVENFMVVPAHANAQLLELLYFTFGWLICQFFRNNYLIIFVTTPAPTVFPPSRIAKRSFSSIATGLISLTVD